MNDKEQIRKIKNAVYDQIDVFLSMDEICDSVFLDVGDVNWLISQAEQLQRMKTAIQNALATMQRGGPGTRSQVQHILENALK